MVNGKGRDITDADLIAEAATCGIPESKVRTMLAEVEAAMKKDLLLDSEQSSDRDSIIC